jgi:SAM-dependent methyltransferase
MIDRRYGRELFGADPAGYDAARPGHPDRVFEVLVERCGLRPGTAVLEVGPGTGQATRRLLELGADPLVAVEPDPQLAEYLTTHVDGEYGVLVAPLEDAELRPETFDLAVAASAFHWVDEAAGLATMDAALRSEGWIALWWTLFGEGGKADSFIEATSPLLEGLESSPTKGLAGRPAHALDVEARTAALEAVGFSGVEHELVRWRASWDTAGIRALYGSFSPIIRLEPDRRHALLDEIARIAEDDFGGHVERALTTSLYTARKPS